LCGGEDKQKFFSLDKVRLANGSTRFHQIGGTSEFRILGVYSLSRNQLVPFLLLNQTQESPLGAERFHYVPLDSRTKHTLNVAEYESLNLHNLTISIRHHDVSETMLITIQLENHANSSTDLKKKSSNQKVNKKYDYSTQWLLTKEGY
jgi:hypothetical protein